ncbi:MAG: hypothetical protein H0V74_05830 [Chloroflexi bacterium]|nr:hypothetical protein [Chloroflexota bacterium]
MSRRLFRSLAGVTALTLALILPGAASANHSWDGYHWARTTNPFTLKLGDNVDSRWDSYLATTSADWTASTVLNTTIVAGGTRSRNCRPTTGRVEVCNASYGNTGWLGLASIFITGGVHITQGHVKNNDTYFDTAQYNTPAWRNLVMCQEVGHTLGLDHQDEAFDNPNLGTCMDYTNDPSTNQHPNGHDYDQLAAMYAHLDSSSTVGAVTASSSGAASSASEFGRLVSSSSDGKVQTFVRQLRGGNLEVTFVIWA